ncbi:MAG TPA: PadR family transcriptional regulator [Nitriliruptorales bacterium]|nr:PadR family transcriptional regulator [Nitriliruptorales bacterium]
MDIDRELAAAPATPLVLTFLSEGESYGYAIVKRVRELSGDELEWTDGMLYPLLHRLRRLGYVTTEWRTPPGGRRRRYYAITDDGQAALAKRQRQWGNAVRALGGMWRGAGWLLTALGERDGSFGVTDRWLACDGRPRLCRPRLSEVLSAVIDATPA